MWLGHGRQAAGAAHRNVDPDGAGAGGTMHRTAFWALGGVQL